MLIISGCADSSRIFTSKRSIAAREVSSLIGVKDYGEMLNHLA